jgi:hypothetical protein
VGRITVVRRLALAALFIGFGLVLDTAHAQDDAPDTVLELFTSQGCSSCPPADALLGELAKTKGVLALTMPVTYWDHLGWKDTLATENFSKRQRGYAEARGDHEIYTPQLIVNGIAQVVGSRKDAILSAIDRTRGTVKPLTVPLKVTSEGESIIVKTAAGPQHARHRGGTVWVAFYSQAVNVDIRRGENLGKKITYTNVVRHLVPAGRWEGEVASFKVSRPKTDALDGCAAFLQADQSNTIVGVAVLSQKTN